jgi:hypothetical protein
MIFESKSVFIPAHCRPTQAPGKEAGRSLFTQLLKSVAYSNNQISKMLGPDVSAEVFFRSGELFSFLCAVFFFYEYQGTVHTCAGVQDQSSRHQVKLKFSLPVFKYVYKFPLNFFFFILTFLGAFFFNHKLKWNS